MTYEEKLRFYIKLCEEDLVEWKKKGNRVAFEMVKGRLHAYENCLSTYLTESKSEEV